MLASLKDDGQLMRTDFLFKELSQESRFPALGGCRRHKVYSVLKQEWGPVHSHTVVQHCLLSSCTELPLKSIRDAYGTFLERDINQKYIHSSGGVCVCM